jgi:cytochrome c oxidase assembly protein subunit 15
MDIDFASQFVRRDTRVARPRVVAAWLFACCALVFALVVIGGVTRLTHSGLSITEWAPVAGTLPPLSDADWDSAFAKYRATPEYAQVNHAMSVTEFKSIFWFEYVHRLLGRLVGVAFLVPFLWFLARGAIPAGYRWPLAGIFVLGGLQGAMGWYMVQSGLVDDPRVSQFRLAAHLALALLIFASMFWIALSLTTRRRAVNRGGLVYAANAVVALVFTLAVSGAFVAGIRAGFAYNTFPLMNGAWVPPEIGLLDPWWKNPFWNMATVQFDHRLLAWVLALAVPLLCWRVCVAPGTTRRARSAALLLVAALAAQVALGIATLLLVVPVHVAACHQAGALLLFACALLLAHAVRDRSQPYEALQ